MFGHHYFGKAYFGPAYFGPSAGAVVTAVVDFLIHARRIMRR